MGILEIFFLILIVLACIILTFFIMIQDDTGEGMGGIFGGASTTPFGSRAGNVLTRVTTVLAVIFFVSTIGYAYLRRTPTGSADILGKAKAKQYEKTAEKLWFIPSEQASASKEQDKGGNLLLEGTSDQSKMGSVSSGTTTSTTVTTTTSSTADKKESTTGAGSKDKKGPSASK